MWTSWWWELWSWNLFPRNQVRNDSRSWRRLAWSNVWSWCWTGGMVGLPIQVARGQRKMSNRLTLSKNMIASENLQHGWCLVGAFCNVLDCTRNTHKLEATWARVDVWCARTSCNENLKHCAYLPRSARASRGCLHDFGGLFSQVVLPKNVNPGPRDVSASDMWNHARSRDQEMRHVFPACLDA